ncbi:MAG: cyclic nucleotide-binding domain-containing protein [Fibrobacterales bacterium]
MSKPATNASGTFNANEYLFAEGDLGNEMYIIRSGEVDIIIKEGEKSVTVATLGPGAVLGELSLFDNEPRSASAMATQETQVVTINRAILEATYKKIPPWLVSIIKILVSRLRDTTHKKYQQDLKHCLPSLLRVLITHKGEDEILISQIVAEVESLYGLPQDGTRRLLSGLFNVSLIEMDPDVVIVNDFEAIEMYYQYLYARHNHTRVPEETVTTEEQVQAIQFLKYVGFEKGSKKGNELQITINQLALALKKSDAPMDEPTFRDALDALTENGVVREDVKKIKSMHSTHSESIICVEPERFDRVFKFREYVAIFRISNFLELCDQ